MLIRLLAGAALAASAQVTPGRAIVYFDFGQGTADLSPHRRSLRLHGAEWHDLAGAPPSMKDLAGRRGLFVDGLQAGHGPALQFLRRASLG